MAEARKSTQINSSVLWVAAGIALVLIFFGVRQLTREKLPIQVAEAQIQDLTKTSPTNGKVEPTHDYTAHAPEAALVKAVYVHAGENAPKGKLLLQLDDADARSRLAAAAEALSAAQAQLHAVQSGGSQQQHLSLLSNIDRAKITRDQAAHNLASLQKLATQGAAAPSEVAQAREQLAVATSALNSLQQQSSQPFAPIDLEHAKSAIVEAQAAYDAAAEVVAQCNVRAPFAGTVYSLPFSRYEYVETGATLLQMANLDKLRVRAYFDEPEIGDLKLGDPATIEWNAKPGKQWHGYITALPSTIIPYGTTRNVGEVLVSIEDGDHELLPNTNVTVTVTTEEVHNALTIPREALHIEDGRDYVYVASGDKLRRVEVRVGQLNLIEVQILSGIQAHTVVARGTTNGAPISNGAVFRIVN